MPINKGQKLERGYKINHRKIKKEIDLYMITNRINRAEMAKRVGVTHQTMYNIKKKGQKIDMGTIIKMTDLGLEVEILIS